VSAVKNIPDYVQRRVIVEYGRRYVYATLTDSNGKILHEELFTQPYMLDPKDASEEAKECWDSVYQHISDTVVFPGSASDDGEDDKPES
jgi:hypothetical protein